MLKQPVRIFLYGYYGANNVGDDLLLAAIMNSLGGVGRNVEFVVKCLNQPLHISHDHVEFVQIEQLMVNTKLSKLHRLINYSQQAWQSLSGCDLFVFGGGTLFHARNNSLTNLLLIFMWVAFAKLRGAKVYALGVGVSPLRGAIAKRIFRMVVNRCSDFAVRDVTSLRQCDTKLITHSKVRLTADIIFSEYIKPSKKETVRLVLGLTLAASDLTVFYKNRPELFVELAQAISTLSSRGWTIRLIIFQKSDDLSKFSDAILFDELQIHCQNVVFERATIRPCWAHIRDLYKDLSVVVGMRFHGHVIAAITDTPFVGLSEDHKVSDLCQALDMPSLSLEHFTADQLVEATVNVKARHVDIRKLNALTRLANDNYSRIRNAIQCA
jgi:polysaccharide pyruvyl transferase WcaK-like protein